MREVETEIERRTARGQSRHWAATLIIAVLSLAPTAPAAAEPGRIPLEHFFAEPEIRSVQMSPDGKYAAFLTTLGTGKVGIAMLDLATGKVEPLVSAKDENYEFFFWKGANYIVFGGDRRGNESVALRSFHLRDRRVIPLAGSVTRPNAYYTNPAIVLDQLRHDPDRILVYGNHGAETPGNFNFGVYWLDVRNGRREMVPELSEGGEFLCDRNGAILGRVRLEGKEALHEVRPAPGKRWQSAGRSPAEDGIFRGTARMQILSVDGAAGSAYVLTRTDTDTGALRRCNLATVELGPVLFHHQEGEIRSLILNYDGSKLLGVEYETDRPHYHWFDAERAALQQKIDASLPGTFNRIIDSTPDESLRVVMAESDRVAPNYYLLNLKAAKPALMLLGCWHGKLDPAQLAERRPIHYQSRDGLTVHGYLTVPIAAQSGRRVPLIVLPHDGPFGARDLWGFDAEIQFLANRGYAVLQPNFRGSGGYGLKFMLAGKREWAGKMQNDVSDGIKWAVAQGWADPERVAIYGAGYGGFAALAGVAFTPELYRCAINHTGPTDLTILGGYPLRQSEVGELYAENWIGAGADLRQRSPVFHVDRIAVPTLHIYGENDPYVDTRHWRTLEKALKQQRRPYEVIFDAEEGHRFTNERSRLACYQRMEEFLSKHLSSPQSAEAGTN